MDRIKFRLCAVIVLFGCGQKMSKVENFALESEDTTSRLQYMTEDCFLESQSAQWLAHNARKIIDLSDSCIILELEKIKVKSFTSPDYLITLDSIYSNSDGAISELFIDLMSDLFYSNYSNLSNYLTLNSESGLNEALIESLSMEIAMSENMNRDRLRVKRKIETESSNVGIKDHMLSLESKLNPEMFD